MDHVCLALALLLRVGCRWGSTGEWGESSRRGGRVGRSRLKTYPGAGGVLPLSADATVVALGQQQHQSTDPVDQQ